MLPQLNKNTPILLQNLQRPLRTPFMTRLQQPIFLPLIPLRLILFQRNSITAPYQPIPTVCRRVNSLIDTNSERTNHPARPLHRLIRMLHIIPKRQRCRPNTPRRRRSQQNSSFPPGSLIGITRICSLLFWCARDETALAAGPSGRSLACKGGCEIEAFHCCDCARTPSPLSGTWILL
jgi:hypothetical protein